MMKDQEYASGIVELEKRMLHLIRNRNPSVVASVLQDLIARLCIQQDSPDLALQSSIRTIKEVFKIYKDEMVK